jgi:energy-coupling factor transporter transmembrane protein EcfT
MFFIVGIVFLGAITPFVDRIHVIQMFFLIVPMFLCFIICLFILVVGLIHKNKKQIKYSILILLPLILFQLPQFLSVYAVDKFQRNRSEKIIVKLDEYKKEFDYYPVELDKELCFRGITYKLRDDNEYELAYERGFFVTERFTSKNREWKSYGWSN